MKNVTKILTVVVLCGAMFASTQRTDALGGSQFWPGDESNIASFPAQVNSHAYVQLSGVGAGSTLGVSNDDGGASILFQKDGTTWGFNYGSSDWVNMHYGDGGMGITFGLQNQETNAMVGDPEVNVATSLMNYSVGYGNTFSFGELGVHYKGGDSYDDAMMNVYMKSDFSFWLFDDTYVGLHDLTGDMILDADFYSHMDAGGADVVYGWGVEYDTGDAGGMTQTATLGVEANMTDWATLRAGYNWSHALTNDADNGDTGVSAGTFAWGLGFNWGGLTADFTVDSDLLLDPIGTVTGNNDDAGGLNTAGTNLTLTYSF
jgi:hypothetical protein